MAFSFDAENRIVGSNGLQMTRDADGRIASITYGSGKTVKYSYDATGLLASVADWIGGATAFSYDAAHRLTKIIRPNQLGTQFTYDADGRVTVISEDTGASINVQRDAAGRIVGDNRTKLPAAVPAPGVSSLTFDAASQVATFKYDAMGRVTSDGLRSYTWDLASRLTSYSGADGAASATYDGMGLRLTETSGAGTANYTWNYGTPIPSVATAGNASGDQRYYVYRPDGQLLYAIERRAERGTFIISTQADRPRC